MTYFSRQESVQYVSVVRALCVADVRDDRGLDEDYSFTLLTASGWMGEREPLNTCLKLSVSACFLGNPDINSQVSWRGEERSLH